MGVRGARQTLAVVMVVLLAAACTKGEQPQQPAPEPEPVTSAPPVAGTVVDGVRIEVSTAAADEAAELTVGPGDAPAPEAAALVASTGSVRVELDGGRVQPAGPVTLSFDLSGRPDLAGAITEGVIPVVESVSTTDPAERDMFPATWDAATKTVTAEVDHLSDFWVSLFNVGKAIADGVGRVFELARGDSRSPCRKKSELTIGDTEYVLTAVSPGAVAGCLVDDGGAVAIDFENATGAFYSIAVSPESAGGNWVVTEVLDMGDAGGSLFSSIIPNSKGVLAGRSKGRLTLNKGVTECDVRMTPQQQGILVKALLAGIDMFGIDLKRFDGISEGWDCLANAINVTQIDAGVTAGELDGFINGFAQCAIAAGEASADVVKKAALHRLGVAVLLLAELPHVLWDFVAVGLEELGGNAEKDFRLRSTTRTTTTPAPPPADPVIDRIDLTTWAYDRVEGNTYVADNTGGKKITVYFKSMAGDEVVKSGCKATVRIQGPGTDKTATTSNCSTFNPGVTVDARRPGNHTVTVTVEPEGRAPITEQVVVTVLPHR
ncbi:MAG: hypothetical protein IRZ17_00975 [Mycolicibacterium hassiacum]|uniref:hypothetical protein n=1 Tax=Mycolicibacterium hassiacum TaxID=46351 RepID=UPI0023F83EA2|nr:hypothetical protein [Mycolicibacterium hassiacum]MBX5485168.1 hypothetical protein [Mycolicibacterium hassiacum]